MKIIVISEEWRIKNTTHTSFEYIHYRSAIKALDNLKEIMPNVVIIDTRDFPRHWKVLAQHLQSEHENVQLILLTAIDQEGEITLHAHAIDPDIAIIPAKNTNNIISKIQMIVFPNEQFEQLPNEDLYKMPLKNVFFSAHCIGESIVGDVLELSIDKLVLRLHHTPIECPRDAKLENCELRINDTIIHPHCTVISDTNPLVIALTWHGMSKKAQAIRLVDEIQKAEE